MDNKKAIRNLIIYLGIPIAVIIVLATVFSGRTKTTQKYSEIINEFENQNVVEYSMDLGNGEMIIKLKDGRSISYVAPSVALLYDDIKPYVEEYNKENPNNKMVVDLKRAAETSWLVSMLPTLIIFALGIFFWLFMMRRMNANMGDPTKQMNFGKAKIKNTNDEKRKTTFKDVAGADEEKEELEEIVAFLKDPTKYNQLGARIPKGVLLVGPPGTGKTLLARAVAGEAGVPFFSISGSDFVEMFVGVGASRVRDLFDQAKKNHPCIIFIDEIDAVGRQRGAGLGGGNDEREQTLNQMLVEMDGFDTNSSVIVIAATNRPDVLDPALLRPGRFDRQVVVPLPDIRGREQILKVHMRKIPVGADVDESVLARGTPGFSGADLANLVNEAALFAARRNGRVVAMEDFERAKDKIMMGAERKAMVMSEDEKRNTAYHESGHALVARLMPKSDPVHKVTIIPRGRALGLTMQLPAEDHYSYDKQYLLSRIAILFGGRIAEEVFMHQMTTGASNDFERATQMARDMVVRYGMSDVMGPMVYGENENEVFLGRSVTQSKHISESTMEKVDAEVRRIIDEQYAIARKLIESHQDEMHKMANALLEWETIDAEQIDDIMNGKDPRPPKQLSKVRRKNEEAAQPAEGEQTAQAAPAEEKTEQAPQTESPEPEAPSEEVKPEDKPKDSDDRPKA